MKEKSGFTLLEVFVVSIILSMVALFLVPQFSQAANESRTGKLCKQLQRVRSYINIYKAQHENSLPGSGDLGFVEAMTCQTDSLGNKYATGVFKNDVSGGGPYLSSFPRNPFNGLNTVDINGSVGDSSHGWHFNPNTGAFIADDRIDNSRL